MKCLILAAGYATRLYPLTENFPKPLLKVGDKTILDYLVDDIGGASSVSGFVIISNHKFAEHFRHWASGKSQTIEVVDDGTSTNETRLGAVCDIQYAIDKLHLDEDLVVMAGDNLLDFSLKEFVLYASEKRTSCVMRYCEHSDEKLHKCGVLQLHGDLITDMEEKPLQPKSHWCCPPFYYYTREDAARISQAIAEGCGTDAPGSFIAWLCKKTKVHAMEMPGHRYDIGTLESYLTVVKNASQRQKMKTALITGITGQDGSFLAEFLLEKGYEVHGIIRRSSSFNTGRIEHLYLDEWVRDMKQKRLVNLHYGDMTDSSSLVRIIQTVQPDEIYNLAAQSHVKVSFDCPEYTAEADATGVLRLLEAVRILGLEKKCKIYQASTSELFGLVQEVPQKETTPFYPRSPYGVAKQYGFWITKNYRESYGMFAVNGILFNHESERRGETFVTRKITLAAARIAQGYQDKLYLGNLNSLRDWGYAKDYVECMWLILQQEKPEDFVIATGEYHTVREFATLAFRNVGIELKWEGEGVDEKGICVSVADGAPAELAALVGKVIVEVDPKYFRPAEVEQLLGDPTKAKTLLGWNPRKTSFEQLVKIMIDHDMKFVRKLYLKSQM